jgi:hypothetical protein
MIINEANDPRDRTKPAGETNFSGGFYSFYRCADLSQIKEGSTGRGTSVNHNLNLISPGSRK